MGSPPVDNGEAMLERHIRDLLSAHVIPRAADDSDRADLLAGHDDERTFDIGMPCARALGRAKRSGMRHVGAVLKRDRDPFTPP